MSILSVDNISPIGSGTSVTINNAATLVLNNVSVAGVTTISGTGTNGLLKVERASGAGLHIQAQSALGVFGTTSNHNLRIISNGNERMMFLTNGNVGINESSPDRKLHVGGSFIRVDDGYGLDTSGATERVTLDNGFITLTTNSLERLRIDSSGNLATGGVASPASSATGNIYIKAASTVGSNGTGLNLVSNAHFNSGWKHIATGAASYLQLNANGHLIYSTEASASAGASATFDRVFKVGIDGGTILNGGLGFSSNLSITDAMAKVQIMGAVHTSFTRANSYLHIGGNESHSSPGMLQTISFGHVKTSTTHAPAYIGLLTTDRNAQEKGQIEIATRDVTTDTMPTPSLIVRPSKSIVRRGPDYANYIVSMQTVNGGGTARNVQVLEDCYGQWLVVAKITSTDEFKGTMNSTGTLDTTNNQITGNPHWSCLFGDTYPSEVRYISASDWEYWRETRIIDFVHGVPNDRKWKNFFTNGQSSDMPVVANSKLGWTCAGCYDGFGRWRNPRFINHKMSDNVTNTA